MLSELLFLSMAVTPFEEPGPFGNDCRHSATRQASADVSGARRIRIEALAGSLKIEGRAGAGTVGAHGRACAESESLLGQVQLEVGRQSDEVVVRVKVPEEHGWG